MNGLPVIIASGDISGLATALGLARKGLTSIVLERIFVALDQLDALLDAAPPNQPDAVST